MLDLFGLWHPNPTDNPQCNFLTTHICFLTTVFFSTIRPSAAIRIWPVAFESLPCHSCIWRQGVHLSLADEGGSDGWTMEAGGDGWTMEAGGDGLYLKAEPLFVALALCKLGQWLSFPLIISSRMSRPLHPNIGEKVGWLGSQPAAGDGLAGTGGTHIRPLPRHAAREACARAQGARHGWRWRCRHYRCNERSDGAAARLVHAHTVGEQHRVSLAHSHPPPKHICFVFV